MRKSTTRAVACWPIAISAVAILGLLAGCGPNYHRLRVEGQTAMLDNAFGAARFFFEEADQRKPRRVENLHDLAACSVILARQKFTERNHAAAMRELDRAVSYYRSAIDVHPGHQASIEGLNLALELKGQFDEALKEAEWAAAFVGPSAKQFLYLARELEERGDQDGALLRYRQAVAVEPGNAAAHTAIARFLLRCGNEIAAVRHLQAAYRLHPADPWVADELSARGAVPVLASPVDGDE